MINNKHMDDQKTTQNPKQNNRHGKRHSWVVEDIPRFKVAMPLMKSMTIYMSVFDENQSAISDIIQDMLKLSVGDKITFVFNSGGGLVSEGKALINTALSTGADIQTEVLSNAYSMAAIAFCVGDRRVVYENSSFMFHNFSGGTMGKSHEMEAHLKHSISNIHQFFKGHILGLNDKEMKKLIKGEDYWFNARELCSRGIATHINIRGILVPSKRYLKILDKVIKKADKKGIKLTTLMEAERHGFDVINQIIEKSNKDMSDAGEALSNMVESNEFLYN